MATVVPSIACLGVIGRNNNPLHLTIFPSYNPVPSSTSSLNSQEASKTSPLRTPLQFSLLLSSTLDVFELRARAHAASGAGALSGDLGLLCAVDERLACYGYETNTGVRFVAVVDTRGRLLDPSLPPTSAPGTSTGGREGGGKGGGPGGDNAADSSGGATTASGAGGGDVDANAVNVPAIPPLSGIGILPTTTTSSFTGTSTRKTSIVASIASASTGLRDAELKPLFKAMQTAWIRLLQNPFFELDDHVPPSGRGGRKITSRKFGDEMQRLGSAWIPGVGSFEGF